MGSPKASRIALKPVLHGRHTRRKALQEDASMIQHYTANQLWSHSSCEGEERLLIRLTKSFGTQNNQTRPPHIDSQLEASMAFSVSLDFSPAITRKNMK
jgi:hypothetical protein